MCRIWKSFPVARSSEVEPGVTRAAGACTCICGKGRWAEQTHRLTCRAPATCTGRRQTSWRWRRSGSPATEPSGPVTKLDPPDHLQPVLGLHWTQEANGGQNIRPLGGLISWLLRKTKEERGLEFKFKEARRSKKQQQRDYPFPGAASEGRTRPGGSQNARWKQIRP